MGHNHCCPSQYLNSSLQDVRCCNYPFSFCLLPAKLADIEDTDGEGTRHFMVNVIEPQFNLHSEDANVS